MEPASPAEPRSPLAAARSSWVATALRRDVVSRSARVALVVGTLLVAINYGDRLLAGELRRSDFVKMPLTYLVPFGVSTHASVAALRSRVADAPP